MAPVKSLALFALATGFASIASAGAAGDGTTTRYFDCCKPSCSWPGKSSSITGPVQACSASDAPITDANAKSGCDGGDAFTCSSNTAFVDPDNDLLAYGFAAVHIAGGTEDSWCCSCYNLTFTSTTLATSGKSMIVQATSTGGDLGDNHFDLAFPGGGNGIFDGCTKEWGTNLGGAQYGGISAKADCSALPAALQAGCNFRFDWFEGADNPTVKFEQVTCPAVLTGKTGCARTDDDAPTSPSSYSSMAAPPKSSSAAAVASSAAAAAVPSPESSATAAAPSATVASSASAASSASPATSAGSAQTYAPSPVASEQASLPVVSSPSSAAVVASSYSAGQAYESMPAASGIVSAPLSSGTAPADEDCKVQYTTIYDL